jgi:membrane protein YdbS with pleckstrin-like domain
LFTNLNVPLESLPAFADAEYHPMDPRYPRLVLGTTVVVELAIFAALAIFLLVFVDAPDGLRPVALGGALLVLTWIGWFSYKFARVLRFAVREHDVIVRSGIFFRKETVQPISRVQHVERVQGPLDKRYGLAKLKLFSAGTGGVSFAIPGLAEETALRLQSFILARKREIRETTPPQDGIADSHEIAPVEPAPRTE